MDTAKSDTAKAIVGPYEAEFPSPTQETIDKIKAALPAKTELFSMTLKVPEGVVLLLTPAPHGDWRKMLATNSSGSEEQKTQAVFDLINAAVKYPDPLKLSDMMDRWAGLPRTISDKIAELTGSVQEVQIKKL